MATWEKNTPPVQYRAGVCSHPTWTPPTFWLFFCYMCLSLCLQLQVCKSVERRKINQSHWLPIPWELRIETVGFGRRQTPSRPSPTKEMCAWRDVSESKTASPFHCEGGPRCLVGAGEMTKGEKWKRNSCVSFPMKNSLMYCLKL